MKKFLWFVLWSQYKACYLYRVQERQENYFLLCWSLISICYKKVLLHRLLQTKGQPGWTPLGYSCTMALSQWEMKGWEYHPIFLKRGPKGTPITRLASTPRTFLTVSEIVTVWVSSIYKEKFTLHATAGQGHVVSFPHHWTPHLLWDGIAQCSSSKDWWGHPQEWLVHGSDFLGIHKVTPWTGISVTSYCTVYIGSAEPRGRISVPISFMKRSGQKGARTY